MSSFPQSAPSSASHSSESAHPLRSLSPFDALYEGDESNGGVSMESSDYGKTRNINGLLEAAAAEALAARAESQAKLLDDEGIVRYLKVFRVAIMKRFR